MTPSGSMQFNVANGERQASVTVGIPPLWSVRGVLFRAARECWYSSMMMMARTGILQPGSQSDDPQC